MAVEDTNVPKDLMEECPVADALNCGIPEPLVVPETVDMLMDAVLDIVIPEKVQGMHITVKAHVVRS